MELFHSTYALPIKAADFSPNKGMMKSVQAKLCTDDVPYVKLNFNVTKLKFEIMK